MPIVGKTSVCDDRTTVLLQDFLSRAIMSLT